MGQARCYCCCHYGRSVFPYRWGFQPTWIPLQVYLCFSFWGSVGRSLPIGQVMAAKGINSLQHLSQQQEPIPQYGGENSSSSSSSSSSTFFVAVAAAAMGTAIVALLLWNARAIVIYLQRQHQRRWGQGPAAPAKVVAPVATARPTGSGNNSLGFGSTLSAAGLDRAVGGQSWVVIDGSSGQTPNYKGAPGLSCQSHIYQLQSQRSHHHE